MSAGVASALAGLVAPEALEEGGSARRWAGGGREPEAVIRPGSADEVAAVLTWAGREGIGVVPAGTGRHTRPRPLASPYVVLSSERFAGVEIYEPADLTLSAGAGTTVASLERELEPHRQWLPFDPADVSARTLGGLVACGESGPLATGYGALRNHVLGATVVRGDGEAVRLGGRVVKNVAGFDLLKAMVGSRGDLAFLTSVVVRVFPVPACDALFVRASPTASGVVLAARTVCTAAVLPVSVVVLGNAAVADGGAALVVRLHGRPETVAADRRTLETALGGPLHEPRARTTWLAAARDHVAGSTVVVRASVRPARIDEAVVGLESHAPEAPLVVDAYGGRVRVGLESEDAARAFARSVRPEIEAIGGTLGLDAAPPGVHLDDVLSRPRPEEAELARGVKAVFDPEGVMWRRP